jgi:hypothetical protein
MRLEGGKGKVDEPGCYESWDVGLTQAEIWIRGTRLTGMKSLSEGFDIWLQSQAILCRDPIHS